jgi:anti-sigma regulatory factor (Ser/Thr protein kinase)
VARRRLGADLRAYGIAEPAVGDAALVLSELLSNSIRYAHPLPGAQIRVTWTLNGGTVQVAVSDGGGPTRPHPVPSSPSSVGGRGLSIVALLARRWGVRDDELGTTVWAELPASQNGGGQRAGSADRMTSASSPRSW